MPTPGDFNGWPTQILENKFVRIEYLAHSARIVRFAPQGKPNMLADLGNEGLETPYGTFHFRGGHRLWHSPEAMPRTYLPDNEGATVSELPDGIRIDAPAEPWSHIAKNIEIRLSSYKPTVTLRHEMRNDGAWPVEFAPWALTMMRLGGVGIFPQPVGNVDESGLLANRMLAIWPYTKINDPRLVLRDDAILVRATPSLPPIKFGYFNPHGWMAYWLEGVLFVKRYDPNSGAAFPDGGCNAESYCNHKFIELETLAPLTKLAPGKSIVHTETWEIYETLDVPFISEELKAAIIG